MSIGYRKRATYHRWQGFYDAEFPCNPFIAADEDALNNSEEPEEIGAGALGPSKTLDIIWHYYFPRSCCFSESETEDCPTCQIALCKFLQGGVGFPDDCCTECTEQFACCHDEGCSILGDTCACKNIGGVPKAHDSKCSCEPDECGECGENCEGPVTELTSNARSDRRFTDPVGACCVPVTRTEGEDHFLGKDGSTPFGFHGNPSWECRMVTKTECAELNGIFHRGQKECGGSFSGPCYCGTEPIGSCCYCNGESATNCVEGVTERQCEELGCLQPDGESTYSYWSECGHCGEGGFNYPGSASCKDIAAANFGYIDPDNNPSGLKHSCCFGEECSDTVSATCQCECQGGTVVCSNSASCSCGADTCAGQPDTSFTDGANSDLNRRDGKVFVGKPKQGYGGLPAAEYGHKVTNSKVDPGELSDRESSFYQDPIMGRDTRMGPQQHILPARMKHHGVHDNLRMFERGERQPDEDSNIDGAGGGGPCDPEPCDLGGGDSKDPNHNCRPCGFTIQGISGSLDSPAQCLGSDCCKATNCACGVKSYEPGSDDEPDCCKLIYTEQCELRRQIVMYIQNSKNVSPSGTTCDGSISHFNDREACDRGYEPFDINGLGASCNGKSNPISCDNRGGAYSTFCGPGTGQNGQSCEKCADDCRCYGTENFTNGQFQCCMTDSEHYGCMASKNGFSGTDSEGQCPPNWQDGPAGEGTEGCDGHQEDYACCTHDGVISHILATEDACEGNNGKKGSDGENKGASVSCIRQHTYNCLWDDNAYEDGGALIVQSGEYYKVHGVECEQFGAQAIAGEFLFGDYAQGGTGNQGCADELCGSVCGVPAGDSCVTIRANVLSQLSQNAKIFMRNNGDDEYSCQLVGYWGEEDGEIDPATCAGPEREEVCEYMGEGDSGADAYKDHHPMHKSCIAESFNHHMQKLIDEANEEVAKAESGPEAALNLSPEKARAVAVGYYEAFVNLNFLSRWRGFSQGEGSKVPNAYWKTRGTIIDYSSVVELPLFLSYVNTNPGRIGPLLGKLVGLERSGAISGAEETGGNSLKPWNYLVQGGVVLDPAQDTCDTTDPGANLLYPECLYNNLSIPTSPLCNDICPLRAGELRDFTIGDFIDTHGNCQIDGSTLKENTCTPDIENMSCYTDRTTMFGPYGDPQDENCVPNALWHDPCATGSGGAFTDVPAIYIAAAAFPEFFCGNPGGELLATIERILDSCSANGFWANREYAQEVQVAANSAGFSSVKEYLRHIGKTTRFDSASTPVNRRAPRRNVT